MRFCSAYKACEKHLARCMDLLVDQMRRFTIKTIAYVINKSAVFFKFTPVLGLVLGTVAVA